MVSHHFCIQSTVLEDFQRHSQDFAQFMEELICSTLTLMKFYSMKQAKLRVSELEKTLPLPQSSFVTHLIQQKIN